MMKHSYALTLSLICATTLFAEEVTVADINVSAGIDTETIKDIHGDEVKSADLADALFKQSPSVSMVRRSGIANDIIVRGQKKDNISVTIDGMKIYGACPNRMDPPVSHVLTNNIDYIELNEGPYNVEDFGVLSADVKIRTIQPEKEFHGDINLGFGSWGYQKASATISGGTDTVRVLVSASTETSEQYEDGDGNDFAQQIDGYIASHLSGQTPPTMADKKLMGTAFQEKYRDMDAYKKQTVMAKLFWNITDNQELRLGYTANRSDDVLYPSSKMDALYDDSDLYNIEYVAKNLGKYSDELTLQLYRSEVEHPMSTKYRKMAAMMGEMTHTLTTQVDGAKLKNRFVSGAHTIMVGADYSLRNWDGAYYKNGNPLPPAKFHSIWDVDTENKALFVSDTLRMDRLIVNMGLRYDNTKIDSKNPAQQDNDYTQLNGYVNALYRWSESTDVFVGFGKSSRVPDAKELYWKSSGGAEIGTPDLDETVNYELDLAFETQLANGMVKGKLFYSMLKDFIAYNDTKAANRYENVDATIYGFELSGTYVATESLYFDYALAYQRGEKDDPLSGQTGTNLPEIPPMKLNAALNYDWDESLNLRAELVASATWDRYDAENGEQEIPSYAVVNLKATKIFADRFELTVGVDNLFDKTYAVSNTYKDLILLTGADDVVMLMNEPGRYVYTNLRYRF